MRFVASRKANRGEETTIFFRPKKQRDFVRRRPPPNNLINQAVACLVGDTALRGQNVQTPNHAPKTRHSRF